MDLHHPPRPHPFSSRWFRYSIALLTSSAIVLAAGIAAALQLGDAGPEVMKLQKDLKQAGFFQGGEPTGYFGETTEAAVIRFQQTNQLGVDGIAGNETLAALNSYLRGGKRPSTPTTVPCGEMRNGCAGDNVYWLQAKLVSLGYYNGQPDGEFGDRTETAVRDFQSTVGLPITGVVTAQTQSTIDYWYKNYIGDRPGPRPGDRPPGYIPEKTYIVVIPLDRPVSLTEVKRWAPNAIEKGSKLGRYIEAEQLGDRASADRLARELKGRGFDAQVRFVK
jgi:peptidoglycan hydrolase-like protein with peptidoglycan-binding domain